MMESEIRAVCDELADFLVEKNRAYGNSVGKPLAVFAPEDMEWKTRMAVRIDDKLSRVKRGHEYPGDDTILDLIGYLVLWRVLDRLDGNGKKRKKR